MRRDIETRCSLTGYREETEILVASRLICVRRAVDYNKRQAPPRERLPPFKKSLMESLYNEFSSLDSSARGIDVTSLVASEQIGACLLSCRMRVRSQAGKRLQRSTSRKFLSRCRPAQMCEKMTANNLPIARCVESLKRRVSCCFFAEKSRHTCEEKSRVD